MFKGKHVPVEVFQALKHHRQLLKLSGPYIPAEGFLLTIENLVQSLFVVGPKALMDLFLVEIVRNQILIGLLVTNIVLLFEVDVFQLILLICNKKQMFKLDILH